MPVGGIETTRPPLRKAWIDGLRLLLEQHKHVATHLLQGKHMLVSAADFSRNSLCDRGRAIVDERTSESIQMIRSKLPAMSGLRTGHFCQAGERAAAQKVWSSGLSMTMSSRPCRSA